MEIEPYLGKGAGYGTISEVIDKGFARLYDEKHISWKTRWWGQVGRCGVLQKADGWCKSVKTTWTNGPRSAALNGKPCFQIRQAGVRFPLSER